MSLYYSLHLKRFVETPGPVVFAVQYRGELPKLKSECPYQAATRALIPVSQFEYGVLDETMPGPVWVWSGESWHYSATGRELLSIQTPGQANIQTLLTPRDHYLMWLICTATQTGQLSRYGMVCLSAYLTELPSPVPPKEPEIT